jgi:hypothetical protein
LPRGKAGQADFTEDAELGIQGDEHAAQALGSFTGGEALGRDIPEGESHIGLDPKATGRLGPDRFAGEQGDNAQGVETDRSHEALLLN